MKELLPDMTKMNSYARFLVKLLVMSVVVFTLDHLIGMALRYFYFTQSSGSLYRTTYALDKTTANIVVFGSSRANHHYASGVLEEELHKKAYNVGRDGNSIFYHYAILKGILSRYKPEVIILDFQEKELNFSQSSYDRLSLLLPYYKDHSEIRDIITLKRNVEKLKLASSIYPFNSTIFSILIGNTEMNKKRFDDINGYIPLQGQYRGSLEPVQSTGEEELDSVKIKMYTSFIRDCIRSDVKLYIVVSPYLTNHEESASKRLGRSIAQNCDVPFWDLSRDQAFLLKPELFSDPEHLNNDGAHIYTKMIAEKIRASN